MAGSEEGLDDMRLKDHDALTFDCYGTLIDWESGIIAGLEPITRRAPQPLSRNGILEAHGRLEAAQEVQTPSKAYSEVLAIVCRRLAESWGVPATWDECLAYGRTVGNWLPFADSVPSLQYLARHHKLVILSNVDNASFARTAVRLEVKFDAIFTAEDIGSYKPALRNFEVMLGELEYRGIVRGRVLHVAESLFHDHGPANRIGLRSCWIHRRHATGGYGATLNPGAVMPRCDYRFDSLAALVEAHRAGS